MAKKTVSKKKSSSTPKKARSSQSAPKRATTQSKAKKKPAAKKATGTKKPTTKKSGSAKKKAVKKKASIKKSVKKKTSAPKATKKKAPIKKAAVKKPASKKAEQKRNPITSSSSKKKSKVKAPTVKKLKSPFSSKELRHIRNALLIQLRDLTTGSRLSLESSELEQSNLTDEADIADSSAASDLALRIAESDSLEVVQIEKALSRIKEGSYGICEVTGKPIERERLEILPFATTSIEAAREKEQQRNDASSATVGWSFGG